MLNYQDIGFLGEWEGYRVATIQRRLWGWRHRVVITLQEEPGYIGVCHGCGCEVQAVHERVYREVRDLPILDAETVVVLQRRGLACPECGPTLERLEWLERYERVTKRLAEAVVRGAADQTGGELLRPGMGDGEGDSQVLAAEELGAGGPVGAAGDRDG